nr:uncharacterized protein LOC113812371 [Penaeus vannamei]
MGDQSLHLGKLVRFPPSDRNEVLHLLFNHNITMNSRVFVALLLCGLWASSESLILLGTTAAAGTIAATTVTASAAAALGVGALAVLKGVLIGKHLKRRYRRDVDSMEIDDEAEVAVAKELDSAGCIAKLLCEIEATPADSLTPSMSTFKTAFENPDNLKSSRIEYDQAIALAKDDPKACSVRFDKCVLSREDLFVMLDTVFHAR